MSLSEGGGEMGGRTREQWEMVVVGGKKSCCAHLCLCVYIDVCVIRSDCVPFVR